MCHLISSFCYHVTSAHIDYFSQTCGGSASTWDKVRTLVMSLSYCQDKSMASNTFHLYSHTLKIMTVLLTAYEMSETKRTFCTMTNNIIVQIWHIDLVSSKFFGIRLAVKVEVTTYINNLVRDGIEIDFLKTGFEFQKYTIWRELNRPAHMEQSIVLTTDLTSNL